MKPRRRIEPVPDTPRPRRRDGVYRHRLEPDHLAAVCWCQATTVGVPAAEIRAGLTRSCGLAACDTHDTNHRTTGRPSA